MSELGDLIVKHGPYETGPELPEPIVFAAMVPDSLNALRDELIALRASVEIGCQHAIASQQPCPAGSSCWQLDGIEPDDASPEAIAIMGGNNGEALP